MGAAPDRRRGPDVARLSEPTGVGVDVMHPLFISALVTAATWGAWRWYVERIWAEPEETAALVLTVAFLGALGLLRKPEPAAPCSIPLVPVALLLAAYAASHAVLPPIA